MLGHIRSGIWRGLAVVFVILGMAALAQAPVSAQDDGVTIDLDELNDSGISGAATLTADGDATVVSIEVTGASGGHPAHIHEGTCDNLNPNPEYPLASVDADGTSETTVEVALDDLTGGEYAINLHESDTNLGTYVACGNIVVAAVGGEEDGAEEEDAAADEDAAEDEAVGGTTYTPPATGVGSLSTSDSFTMLAGLGAVALSLTLGGLALRRREVRL